MTNPKRFRLTYASAVALLTGCSGPYYGDHVCPPEGVFKRPTRISHIVFIKLKDPADAPALIAYSDKTLPNIPGVTRYACGQHLDMGRANVIHDYDVGLYVGFETNDEYAAYVQNPAHMAFVKEWAPKSEWLHIYDFVDDTR